MKNRSHRLAIVVAAVLGATVLLAFPSPAEANDNMPGKPPPSCPGYLLSGFTNPISRTSGSNTLKLYVYYSSANGGTNCAIARKSGAWYGKPTDLSVEIWKSSWGAEAEWPNAAWDIGDYKKYAGAAYITGTNGKCIDVVADSLADEWHGGSLYKLGFACR
jgi:hypothetical protein